MQALSRERQWTFFTLFPGNIWTGWADLISFLASALKFFVCLLKMEVSILSPLLVEPLNLSFPGLSALDWGQVSFV